MELRDEIGIGSFDPDPDCPTAEECKLAEWCGQGCHPAAQARIDKRKAETKSEQP